MNYLQDNRLSMYLAVQKNCQANASLWSTNSVAVQAFADFEQCILTIQQNIRQQERPLTGVSREKADSHRLMIDKAYVLAQTLVTYGRAVHDLEMVHALEHSPSDWKKYSFNLAKEKVEQVLQTARPLLPELNRYGIQNQHLTELETLLEAYTQKIAAPRRAISERRKATQILLDCLQKGDALLKQLDNLLLQYKEEPFYITYKSDRKVKKRGPRVRKLDVALAEN